jgi:hypothetical protein
MTGGIGRHTIRLTEIIIGHFMENKKEMHLKGSSVAGLFLSFPPLDHSHSWICGASRCCLHSGRWRLEMHSPVRFRAC